MTGVALLAVLSAAGCATGYTASAAATSAPMGGVSGPPSISPQLRQRLVSPAPSPGREDRDAYYRQKNAIMVACMKAAGYDYAAYTPPLTLRESLGLSDEEFVRRYGFGISTLIEWPASSGSAAGASADDRSPDDGSTDGGSSGDPNLAAAAKLPAPAQHAYLSADAACEQAVFRQLGPPVGGGPVSGPADDPLQNLIADAATRAESDPRIAQARQRYGGCMSSKGFTATSAEDLTSDITARAAPFVRAYRAANQSPAPAGRSAGTVVRPHRSLTEVLTPAQRTDLAALQRYELAAAAADEACGPLLYPLVDQVHREYLAKALDGA